WRADPLSDPEFYPWVSRSTGVQFGYLVAFETGRTHWMDGGSPAGQSVAGRDQYAVPDSSAGAGEELGLACPGLDAGASGLGLGRALWGSAGSGRDLRRSEPLQRDLLSSGELALCRP